MFNLKSNPKSKTLALSAILGLMLTAPNLQAEQKDPNEPDPCGAVLCLSGINALGGDIGACKPHVKKYFSFGVFVPKIGLDPIATYAKRFRWLNKCPNSDPLIASFKVIIMNTMAKQMPEFRSAYCFI